MPAVVPHVTDAIQEWVERVACDPVARDEHKPDVCVIEVSTRKRELGREKRERERCTCSVIHPFINCHSLVVLLVILRECHLLKRSGSFSFDVATLTLPTFTSAWYLR